MSAAEHPIFEITMFWNELPIFKERIENTLQYAKRFYIAEGNESHSGHLKRDFQLPNLLSQLPKELQNRVEFVPVDLAQSSLSDPFMREKKVRDSAFEVLKSSAEFNSNSVLVVQDFDEFLNPHHTQEILSQIWGWKFWVSGIRLRQHLSYYRLSYMDPADWTLGFACKGSLALKNDFSPNQWRHQLAKRRFGVTPNYVGWHHSYLGDQESIRNKISSFAEAEVDFVKKVTDEMIEKALTEGRDLYGREKVFARIDYAKTNPIPTLLKRSDLL